MAFAILKLSYNKRGDSTLAGGICGSGFLIDSLTGITAHHVLNAATFKPNVGYRHVLLCLISRNGAVSKIERSEVSLHPEIDTSVIRFRNEQPGFQMYPVTVEPIVSGVKVSGIGHRAHAMPQIDAEWHGSELAIRMADLRPVAIDRLGHISRALLLDINANDVKMFNVRGFELSFGSQLGMSGGPVIDVKTGCVLGMLSIGLPPDDNVKTETFAVSIHQILQRIRPDV